MVRRMLEKGNRLTHLDLGWNNVRGEGAKNLAEGINRNRCARLCSKQTIDTSAGAYLRLVAQDA